MIQNFEITFMLPFYLCTSLLTLSTLAYLGPHHPVLKLSGYYVLWFWVLDVYCVFAFSKSRSYLTVFEDWAYRMNVPVWGGRWKSSTGQFENSYLILYQSWSSNSPTFGPILSTRTLTNLQRILNTEAPAAHQPAQHNQSSTEKRTCTTSSVLTIVLRIFSGQSS